MKQIKLLLYSFALIAVSITSTSAQQTPPCRTGWGEWVTLYSFAPGVEFKIAFNMLIKSKAGSFSCQESYYKVSNDYVRKGTYLKFKFNYRTVDGKIENKDMSYELNKTGVRFDNSGDWFRGYELVGAIYDIKFVDPQRDIAKSRAADVNKSIHAYDAEYEDALAQLAKIQNQQKKAELQQSITANRTTFLQYKQQAEQQLADGNGDAMDASLQNMKKQEEGMKLIDVDADVAARNIKIPEKDGSFNAPKGSKSAVIGDRAEVATPKPESAALTANNNNAQQKAAYQQKANSYLEVAKTSPEEINKAMDLNLAKINATAAGNKAQVAEVQQQISQQNTENTEKLINSSVQLAGDLVSLLSSKHTSHPAPAYQSSQSLHDQVAGYRRASEIEFNKKIKEYKLKLLLEQVPIKKIEYVYKISLLKKFKDDGDIGGYDIIRDTALHEITGKNYKGDPFWHHIAYPGVELKTFQYQIPGKEKYVLDMDCSDDGKRIAIAMQSACKEPSFNKKVELFTEAASIPESKNDIADPGQPNRNYYFYSQSVFPKNRKDMFQFGKIGLIQMKAMSNISSEYFHQYQANKNKEDLKKAIDWSEKSLNYYYKNLDTFFCTKKYNGIEMWSDVRDFEKGGNATDHEFGDDEDYVVTKYNCFTNYLKLWREVLLSEATVGFDFPGDTMIVNKCINMYNQYNHILTENSRPYKQDGSFSSDNIPDLVSHAKSYLATDAPEEDLKIARQLLEIAVYKQKDTRGNLSLAKLCFGSFLYDNNPAAPTVLDGFNLIKDGANKGEAECMVVMGDIFAGENDWDKIFKPNGNTAVEWYTRAIKYNPGYASRLARLYYGGTVVPADLLKALKITNTLIELKLPEKYSSFIGSFSDRELANLGSAANTYGSDAYAKTNYKLALDCWMEGYKIGNLDCCYNIGVLYENGTGVPKDLVEAKKYYTIAANKGNKAALERMLKF